MQSVFFGNNGLPANNPVSPNIRPQQSMPTPAASATDDIRFGSRRSESSQSDPASGFSREDKLKIALRAAKDAAFNKRALGGDLLWSVIITILTCWAPGSQLVTVPLFVAGSMAFRAILDGSSAYRHPERFTRRQQAE